MQKSLTKCLSLSLEGHISLWRTRRETLVWLVTLLIQTGTVGLWRLAGPVDARAKTLSVHRRFERFFFNTFVLMKGVSLVYLFTSWGFLESHGLLPWIARIGSLDGAISTS